jgi:hypothetical protein
LPNVTGAQLVPPSCVENSWSPVPPPTCVSLVSNAHPSLASANAMVAESNDGEEGEAENGGEVDAFQLVPPSEVSNKAKQRPSEQGDSPNTQPVVGEMKDTDWRRNSFTGGSGTGTGTGEVGRVTVEESTFVRPARGVEGEHPAAVTRIVAIATPMT